MGLFNRNKNKLKEEIKALNRYISTLKQRNFKLNQKTINDRKSKHIAELDRALCITIGELIKLQCSEDRYSRTNYVHEKQLESRIRSLCTQIEEQKTKDDKILFYDQGDLIDIITVVYMSLRAIGHPIDLHSKSVLNLDDLDLISVVCSIESQLGIQIPDKAVDREQWNTSHGIVNCVQKLVTEQKG